MYIYLAIFLGITSFGLVNYKENVPFAMITCFKILATASLMLGMGSVANNTTASSSSFPNSSADMCPSSSRLVHDCTNLLLKHIWHTHHGQLNSHGDYIYVVH